MRYALRNAPYLLAPRLPKTGAGSSFYICAGGKDVAMLECAGTNMVVPVEILPKPPLTRAAAWDQKSLTRELEDGGNDYLNKELSGGKIILDLPAGAIFVPDKNTISGTKVAFCLVAL